MKHENGSGNAKDVNCDVNADPSAPGGESVGELKWSTSASEIWCNSIMHSMHTTIHNIF